jgi:tetratricopeptide (TPR) repeat protein
LAYANYRVRHCVYQTLEKQYSSRCHLCSQNAAYQLAVCHSIGFSARPDKDVSETWLEKSEHSLELLQGDIYTTAHTYESTIHYNESLSMFWNTGHLHLMNPNTQVKLKEELYEERRCCIDDIENASLGLSPHHTFVLTMRIALVPIEVGLGNLDEACDLCEGIVKELMLDERYGAANVGTWTAVSALAATQYLRGNYARAAELQEEVLDRLLVLRGENDLHTLCAMSDLSLSYYGQDKLDDAKTLLLRIVGGIRSNLGMEHPSTLVIENDLASIFYRQGDLLEAERLFREVLVTKKKILGIGNRSTLATMGNLAVVARYRGNYAEAETLNRQALQVREDILPAGHLDILTNQGNLAAILQAQGKLEEAEPMALKCLENSTAALGPDHPETLTSMHNMASILRDRGKFNEALDLWLVCRQGKENHPSLGPTHTFTLDTISNLGVLYTGMGRLAEARDCHQYVLDTMSKKPEQKDTVAYFSTMRHLSTVYQKMGDYEKAEELATHAYKRQGELFGDTLSTLATMQTYAAVSSSLGRHEEALQLYRSVLEGRATKFDVKHELILDTVDAIGEELRILGQYEEAENYCRRAFNNRKKMYERTHPDVLQSASNLSMTLVASASQGVRSDTVEVLAEAETLAEIALKGHEELFGLHEASTIHMRWRLGIVKKTQGMIRVAEQTLRRAYEELVEVMPESHPDCQQLLQDLVSCKEEIKKCFNI